MNIPSKNDLKYSSVLLLNNKRILLFKNKHRPKPNEETTLRIQ